MDCGGVCGDTCEVDELCDDDDDCVSHNCPAGVCEPEGGGDCNEWVAQDLGYDGNETTVPVNGCVRVRDHYPWWWENRTMMLQTTSPGSYPVPFSWSCACTGSSGTGIFTGDWQNQFLSITDNDCATVIDLQGTGPGTVRLQYYGG